MNSKVVVPGASPPLAAVPSWVHGAGGVLERGCAARWWGGEQKPGVCCLAVLFFSSSPPLLPPSADCRHPGLGRSQSCRDKWVLSGCRAGVGGEGSEPACPVLHGGAAGMLLPITAQHQQGLLRRSLYFGKKRSFSIYLALRTRQKCFATSISSQPCSSVVAARWHRQNRTQIWPRMYPRVIPPGVLMSEMEEVSGDQEPCLGLSRSPQRQPMCLVSRRGGEARLTAATAC